MTETVLQSLPKKLPLILAVDDDRTLRMLLVNKLEELGYSVLEAQDGKQALEILLKQRNNIDAILLDREMPVMNGMALVMRMKENKELRNIPIIMQTGSDRPEQIKEGLDAGVFYYLTKPVDKDVLKSVLSAAVRETEQQRLLSSELQKHKTSFNMIDTCKFRFKTLAEAEHLATFLANCLPDAERAVGGLAELLINSVEHGNLGITYTEKTELITKGLWREEIDRRAACAEYKNKEVITTYRHKPEGYYVTIIDQGKGFDWRSFLYIDPARAADNHGRGVAMANVISFDKLTYNEAGNEVTAFVSKEEGLEW